LSAARRGENATAGSPLRAGEGSGVRSPRRQLQISSWPWFSLSSSPLCQAVRYRPTTHAEVQTMTSGTSGHRRPELGEVLRETTTPDDLLRAIRARLAVVRQREHRAPETTAAVIHERDSGACVVQRTRPRGWARARQQ